VASASISAHLVASASLLGALLIASCGARSELEAPFAIKKGSGCASGARAGFTDVKAFPDIAACVGSFSGTIGEASAASICASGWHVCRGDDPQVRRMTQEVASQFRGCFAYDSASDCGACYPTCLGALGMCNAVCCVSSTNLADPDMAGMGADCGGPEDAPITQKSCLLEGRLDAYPMLQQFGCGWQPSLAGVVCCKG
jgi:hypothetical protein